MPIYDQDQRDISKRISQKASRSNWLDWRWHLDHTVRDIDTFERLLGIRFTAEDRASLDATTAKFPLAVTPYYLSLIDPKNFRRDPVFLQAFPSALELNLASTDLADPLSEDTDSPAPGLTHRYPDRVLFHVSNLCSMYCRHCTRKRKVGDRGHIPGKKQLLKGIRYIKNTPAVRDVLLSGGDPFMLPDERIEWLLGEINAIDHVEIVRIGSRMPIVLPYRVTTDLVRVLKKHKNLWLNTHANHPKELTQSARTALAKLAEAGIPLGNQSVLLAGVNDCPRVIKALVQKLVRNRVRPYYLYQCDLSEGLTHFRTPVGKGIEIIESLVGHTTGFARPTYVIDAPGGGGKIPIMPNYIISWGTHRVVLRNYEGVITTYTEPECYPTSDCDRDCANCRLSLDMEEASEHKAIGIERLLSAAGPDSLTPTDLERMERRDNGHHDS
ncbi:MAG: lysine 2,3-aminomutase [Desulfohalobiaceae bacterium]